MAEQALLDWSLKQPAWIQDALRRIATSPALEISDEDVAAIRTAVLHHAAGGAGSPPPATPLSADHLKSCADPGPKVVLCSLGPVKNIDRLAEGQQLPFALQGITLIYGENGSGKSGYARIAKRICRSLSSDALKGNVFEPNPSGAPQALVRYRVEGQAVTETLWTDGEPPPSPVRQISVFDTANARLYVDSENRIAFLPAEIAILEHHGAVCDRLEAEFRAEQATLERQFKTPLTGGFTPGGAVDTMLARIEPKTKSLPSQADIEALAGLSPEEAEELASLETRLAQDPGAQAQQRRRAHSALESQMAALQAAETALSEEELLRLAQAHADRLACETAAALAADEAFGEEPLSGTGQAAWRQLYAAAKAFAVEAGHGVDALPAVPGAPCPLCQDPMSDQAAARLQRFNAFMQATAAQAAAAARAVVEAEVAKLNSLTINEPHLVAAALAECRAIDSTRAALTERILSGFAAAHARRDALVAALGAPTFETPPALVESPAAAVAEALLVLASEAEELEQRAQQGGASAEDRGRLAALKDRGALKAALPGVLARRDDIGRFLQLKSCRQAVATADISRQITSLRRKMVSEGLEERIQAEIAALDLAHAPFVVNDRSKEGQSLFEVGLKTPGKIANRHVLSEGEQRALALACFLAEVGGDACGHGMLIDDPVSSLDQNRIRKVAERLVAVANQGRQVIVFTHNLVFYNELAAAAAASEPPAPLLKVQISRNAAEGFGLIAADREPWFATSVAGRVEQLDARLKEIGKETAFDTDGYRRLAKDFYTDLRESWERLVEEVLLNKVVERFNTDVRTQSLSGTLVEDADFKKVFFAMRRASERSGHDMAAGKAAGAPTPPQMKADLDELRDYRAELIKRRKQVESARKAMLEAPPAEVV